MVSLKNRLIIALLVTSVGFFPAVAQANKNVATQSPTTTVQQVETLEHGVQVLIPIATTTTTTIKTVQKNSVPKVKRSKQEIALIRKAMSKVPKNQKYRCPKWEPLLREYKLPVELYSYLIWRESRCQTKAIGWNYKSNQGPWDCKHAPASIYRKCKAVDSYDSGLLQINSSWTTLVADICKGRWGDMKVLLEPRCNVKVASVLYAEAKGLGNWGLRVK